MAEQIEVAAGAKRGALLWAGLNVVGRGGLRTGLGVFAALLTAAMIWMGAASAENGVSQQGSNQRTDTVLVSGWDCVNGDLLGYAQKAVPLGGSEDLADGVEDGIAADRDRPIYEQVCTRTFSTIDVGARIAYGDGFLHWQSGNVRLLARCSTVTPHGALVEGDFATAAEWERYTAVCG